MKSLQPTWVSCKADNYSGFYNPPKTLTQGSALAPIASPTPAPPTTAPVTLVPAVSDTRSSSAAAPPPTLPLPSVADPGTSQDPAPSQNPTLSQDPGTVHPLASSAGVLNQLSASLPGTNTTSSLAALVLSPRTSGGASSLVGSLPAAILLLTQSLSAAGRDSVTFILTPPAVLTPAGVQASSTAAVPPVITVGGTAIMPGGASVIISSQTVTLTTPPAPASAPAPTQTPPVITVGGSTITANLASQFVLPGGTTLSARGSTIIINGTPVVILSGGLSIIISSTTQALISTAAPSITITGAIVTPNSSGQYIISGITLAINRPALTVSGTTYKLTTNTAGQTALIVGTTNSAATISVAAVISIALATSTTRAVSEIVVFSGASSSLGAETTTSGGLGGLIISGLSGAESTGALSTQAHPTGGMGSLSMAIGGWFAASLAAFIGMLAL